MSVKLILTWNIKPGKEQEYYGFMVGDYLPRVNELGLELTDAWVTVFGDEPQILVGAIVPDYARARDLLESEGWVSLNDQLLEYVENYVCKVTHQKGAFQF
ncbi:MAG: hypothetical protein WA110_03745 [Anaerolineaceae bacterium]